MVHHDDTEVHQPYASCLRAGRWRVLRFQSPEQLQPVRTSHIISGAQHPKSGHHACSGSWNIAIERKTDDFRTKPWNQKKWHLISVHYLIFFRQRLCLQSDSKHRAFCQSTYFNMEAVRLKACRTVTMGSKITKQRARQTRDTIIPPGIRGNTTYINSTKDISSTKKRMPASGICTIHFRNTWRHRRPYSLGIESGSGYKHTHTNIYMSASETSMGSRA